MWIKRYETKWIPSISEVAILKKKIQYGHHQELIALGTPSKIDHYDPL